MDSETIFWGVIVTLVLVHTIIKAFDKDDLA